METERNNPSILQLAIILVVVVAVVYYAVLAMNTGDLYWFRTTFEGQPVEIIIHCYGNDMLLGPTNANFAELNELINQTISQRKRWDPLSMSDVTYNDYQTHPRMMTLEMLYAPPIRIHTQTKYFSRLDRLIIPLDGRHSEYNTIFGRHAGLLIPGSLHVENMGQLTEYLAVQGLCKQP